jgi:hypothetical protein
LLRIAAHVLKRQNRDRRLVGQRQWRCHSGIRGQCHSLSGDLHIEYPDWPRYILDLLLAPVVEGKIELVAYLVSHHAADANPARRRQGFKPGGDIDAVAVDILLIIHDVAEIDPDAKLDPLIHRNLGVA